MGSRALPLLKTVKLGKSQRRKLPSQERLPRKPERHAKKTTTKTRKPRKKKETEFRFLVSSVVLKIAT